jgi:cytochrome b
MSAYPSKFGDGPDTAHDATAASGPTPLPTRRVVDAAMRMFHWLFAACFVGAYATADWESLRLVHVTLGYTLAGLLVFRIVWGLFGPRQARLSALWRKLAGLPAWFQGLKRGQPAWRQGQNLLMAFAIAGLVLLTVPLTLSGYATYQEWGGDWLEEVHEFFGNTLLVLVLAHLALITVLSVVRRQNQALPMWRGRVPGAGPDLAQRNHGWIAVLLLAAVLAFWGWTWQDAANAVPGPATDSLASASADKAGAADRKRDKHRSESHD